MPGYLVEIRQGLPAGPIAEHEMRRMDASLQAAGGRTAAGLIEAMALSGKGPPDLASRQGAYVASALVLTTRTRAAVRMASNWRRR